MDRARTAGLLDGRADDLGDAFDLRPGGSTTRRSRQVQPAGGLPGGEGPDHRAADRRRREGARRTAVPHPLERSRHPDDPDPLHRVRPTVRATESNWPPTSSARSGRSRDRDRRLLPRRSQHPQRTRHLRSDGRRGRVGFGHPRSQPPGRGRHEARSSAIPSQLTAGGEGWDALEACRRLQDKSARRRAATALKLARAAARLEAEAGVDVIGVVGHREGGAGSVEVAAVDQLGRLDAVGQAGEDPADLGAGAGRRLSVQGTPLTAAMSIARP